MNAMESISRNTEPLSVAFHTYDGTNVGALSSLGAQSVEMQPIITAGLMEQSMYFYERPDFIVPTLFVNPAFFSPEKQAAILNAMAAVIDRLVALEDPEKTTVGELLQ